MGDFEYLAPTWSSRGVLTCYHGDPLDNMQCVQKSIRENVDGIKPRRRLFLLHNGNELYLTPACNLLDSRGTLLPGIAWWI